MTRSALPTATQDFSIHVAENEGMPSLSSRRDAPQWPARTRRLSGTLTLGLSKTRAAADSIRSASEERSQHQEKTKRHPRARLVERTAVLAGVIASIAFPVLARDGTAPLPDNAEARSHGGACVPIAVPENGFLTNAHRDRTGNRWLCDRSFQLSDGECLLGR